MQAGEGPKAIEDKSRLSKNDTQKRPAPRAAGCRIDGFVKVKKVRQDTNLVVMTCKAFQSGGDLRRLFFHSQVPGNLMVSAHSASHSFDAATMNLTHHVGLLSFGRQLTARMTREVQRLAPHLRQPNEDRLTGEIFLSEKPNVTVSRQLF